jgi:hypothetical protein
MSLRRKPVLALVLVLAIGFVPTSVAVGPAADGGAQGLQDVVTVRVIDDIDPFAAAGALVELARIHFELFVPLPVG